MRGFALQECFVARDLQMLSGRWDVNVGSTFLSFLNLRVHKYTDEHLGFHISLQVVESLENLRLPHPGCDASRCYRCY